jgi:hypothetical protein
MKFDLKALGLVKEALHERATVLEIAPHLTRMCVSRRDASILPSLMAVALQVLFPSCFRATRGGRFRTTGPALRLTIWYATRSLAQETACRKLMQR